MTVATMCGAESKVSLEAKRELARYQGSGV